MYVCMYVCMHVALPYERLPYVATCRVVRSQNRWWLHFFIHTCNLGLPLPTSSQKRSTQISKFAQRVNDTDEDEDSNSGTDWDIVMKRWIYLVLTPRPTETCRRRKNITERRGKIYVKWKHTTSTLELQLGMQHDPHWSHNGKYCTRHGRQNDAQVFDFN